MNMKEKKYRISKYDTSKRDSMGHFAGKEWTSISDIGSSFDDGILTYEKYISIENNYCSYCLDLMKKNNITGMVIRQLEVQNKSEWTNGEKLAGTSKVVDFIRDCLREKCWGRLVSPIFEFDFGYDYYLYVIVKKESFLLLNAEKYGLYCETIKK